jgi:hypothetical protein
MRALVIPFSYLMAHERRATLRCASRVLKDSCATKGEHLVWMPKQVPMLGIRCSNSSRRRNETESNRKKSCTLILLLMCHDAEVVGGAAIRQLSSVDLPWSPLRRLSL